MLQCSATARDGCSRRVLPRQAAPAPVWGFRRRLLACPTSSRRLQVVAGMSASEGAKQPAPSSLTTIDGQALSAREDDLQPFIKVAEASGKMQLAEQAKQQQAKVAKTPLEPWRRGSEGSDESVEAFRALSQVLGMPLPRFLTILKGRYYLLSKPVVAVLRSNAQELVQRLGSREAALRVVLKVPDALAMGLDVNNATYAETELGWTDLPAFRPITSCDHYLVGPMEQRLLWLCQQELGLSGKVMRRHVNVLWCPERAITRLAFVSHRRLHGKIKSTGGSDGTVDKDTTFLTEIDSDWRSRLGRWAVRMVLWDSFEREFLESEEWRALQQEEAEFNKMVNRVEGIRGNLEERLERAVEMELERAGAKKSKE